MAIRTAGILFSEAIITEDNTAPMIKDAGSEKKKSQQF